MFLSKDLVLISADMLGNASKVWCLIKGCLMTDCPTKGRPIDEVLACGSLLRTETWLKACWEACWTERSERLHFQAASTDNHGSSTDFLWYSGFLQCKLKKTRSLLTCAGNGQYGKAETGFCKERLVHVKWMCLSQCPTKAILSCLFHYSGTTNCWRSWSGIRTCPENGAPPPEALNGKLATIPGKACRETASARGTWIWIKRTDQSWYSKNTSSIAKYLLTRVTEWKSCRSISASEREGGSDSAALRWWVVKREPGCSPRGTEREWGWDASERRRAADKRKRRGAVRRRHAEWEVGDGAALLRREGRTEATGSAAVRAEREAGHGSALHYHGAAEGKWWQCVPLLWSLGLKKARGWREKQGKTTAPDTHILKNKPSGRSAFVSEPAVSLNQKTFSLFLRAANKIPVLFLLITLNTSLCMRQTSTWDVRTHKWGFLTSKGNLAPMAALKGGTCCFANELRGALPVLSCKETEDWYDSSAWFIFLCSSVQFLHCDFLQTFDALCFWDWASTVPINRTPSWHALSSLCPTGHRAWETCVQSRLWAAYRVRDGRERVPGVSDGDHPGGRVHRDLRRLDQIFGCSQSLIEKHRETVI